MQESAEVARPPAVLLHPIGVTRAVVIVGVPVAKFVLVDARGTCVDEKRRASL